MSFTLLEHWSSQLSLPSDSISDLQYKKLSFLHRLSNGVLGSQVRILLGPLAEYCIHLLIGMVSGDITLAANLKADELSWSDNLSSYK